jgi:hypothetical protein
MVSIKITLKSFQFELPIFHTNKCFLVVKIRSLNWCHFSNKFCEPMIIKLNIERFESLFLRKSVPIILLMVLYFPKKAKFICTFLEKKKNKIFLKNLSFYACSGFLSVTHEVNSSFSKNISLYIDF